MNECYFVRLRPYYCCSLRVWKTHLVLAHFSNRCLDSIKQRWFIKQTCVSTLPDLTDTWSTISCSATSSLPSTRTLLLPTSETFRRSFLPPRPSSCAGAGRWRRMFCPGLRAAPVAEADKRWRVEDELRRARAAACAGRNETKRFHPATRLIRLKRPSGTLCLSCAGKLRSYLSLLHEMPQCVHSSFFTAVIIIENIINSNNFAWFMRLPHGERRLVFRCRTL